MDAFLLGHSVQYIVENNRNFHITDISQIFTRSKYNAVSLELIIYFIWMLYIW